MRVNTRYINSTNLCTLYLPACQVRVTEGYSGLCSTCVTFFVCFVVVFCHWKGKQNRHSFVACFVLTVLCPRSHNYQDTNVNNICSAVRVFDFCCCCCVFSSFFLPLLFLLAWTLWQGFLYTKKLFWICPFLFGRGCHLQELESFLHQNILAWNKKNRVAVVKNSRRESLKGFLVLRNLCPSVIISYEWENLFKICGLHMFISCELHCQDYHITAETN